MNIKLRDDVAGLLMQTGQAHHKAFESTDGADPDWAIWYAEYSRDKFTKLFGMEFQKSQLVYCLMNADFEHQASSPESEWPRFYADELVTRYAKSESASEDKLALYYLETCQFCKLVLSAIGQLDVDVELRNINNEIEHRDDLIEARGRATVPVLRIMSPGGDERWMPESRDIVSYLQKTYA